MSSQAAVPALSAIFFLLLAVPLGVLARRIVKRSAAGTARCRGGRRGLWLLAALAFSVLVLFRPHEHTFTGLDVSGYRLMAGALAEGRPLKSVDRPLLELPRPVRSLVLYRPEHHKPTRDLSFRVDSLETCGTRPFFYPTLPLAMVGFDLVVPGAARDYLVPAAGALFFFALLSFCTAAAGGGGFLTGVAFLLGSVYPVWFFRGSHPESIGAILVAMSMLSWISDEKREGGAGYLESFALGLAVTFHPLLAVIALPSLGAFLVASGAGGPWKTTLGALSFLAGTAPLLLLTKHVTAPYGQFGLRSVAVWWARSPVMGAVLLATAAGCAAFLLALCFRGLMTRKIGEFREGHPLLFSGFLVLLAAAPTAASSLLPTHGALIQRGLLDLRGGVQTGFGALLLGALGYILLRGGGRSRLLVLVASLALPAFLYLKGAEAPDLWGQRRLLPFAVVAVALSAPAVAGALARLPRRPGKGMLTAGAGALLLCLGLSNAVRWPAPYLARQERGAASWVEQMANNFGDSTIVFDYHPYSVPFAVGGKSRSFGLGSYAFEGMSGFVRWLKEAAGGEPVYLVSAYRGGWTEEGIRMEEVRRERVKLDRVRGKRGFPAVRSEKTVDLRIFKVAPEGGGPAAAMEKVFDGGNFGLRPPWGRRDIGIREEGGRNLPAFWSREGSGIVGPVPSPGGGVRIDVYAGARRPVTSEGQAILIVPPWEGDPLRLHIADGYSLSSGVLTRPAASREHGGRTGVYRIHAEEPYDPGNAGIEGFHKDLGVLVHKVGMEEVGR